MPDMWDNLVREIADQADMICYQIREGEISRECESPIEKVFLAAIIFHQQLHGGGFPMIGVPSAERHAVAWESKRPELFIAPQQQVGQYRVDFIVGYAGYGTLKQTGVAVECDGHDFHEKTKEQAQRDKERDRYLQTKVAKVIRFTGSELYRQPLACAESAVTIAEGAMLAWHP